MGQKIYSFHHCMFLIINCIFLAIPPGPLMSISCILLNKKGLYDEVFTHNLTSYAYLVNRKTFPNIFFGLSSSCAFSCLCDGRAKECEPPNTNLSLTSHSPASSQSAAERHLAEKILKRGVKNTLKLHFTTTISKIFMA